MTSDRSVQPLNVDSFTDAEDSEATGARTTEFQPFDLILLDIRMPGMNGFEVCRRLQDDPNTSDIPVIFLSDRVQFR